MNNQLPPHPVEPAAQPPTPAASGKPRKCVSKGVFYFAVISVVLFLAIAIPNFVKARTTASKNACINDLRQIDGAKEQWALEHKKTQTDIPTWDDLVGTDKYIKVMPKCPANGTYTIGNMMTKPVCSKAATLPDHSLQ